MLFQYRKSIKNRMILLFIIILIALISTFSVLGYMHYGTQREYNAFMEKNIIVSKLPIQIEEAAKNIELYLQTREEQYLDNYLERNTYIDKVLEAIKKDKKDYSQIQRYYRTLATMESYQKNSVQNIVKSKALTSQNYEELAFLKLLYDSMKQQSHQLIVENLEINQAEYAHFLVELSKKQRVVLFILILVVGIAVSINILSMKGIFDSLGKINKAANALSVGKWEIEDLELSYYIEMKAVAHAFNNMKHKIRLHIDSIKQKAELEKQLHRKELENEQKDRLVQEARLKFLQMQVNPHFLFNTLNVIGKTAVLEDTEKSLDLIEAISKIMRYTLEHLEEVVTLEEELEVVKAYLFIQKTRFNDQLTVELEVDHRITHHCIPAMLIQPLVENAIKHGLENKSSEGVLKVKIYEKQDYMYIHVIDNGKGFGKQMNSIANSSHRIGLSNIRERLKLFYKEDGLLEINSVPHEETTVTIKIPIEAANKVSEQVLK